MLLAMLASTLVSVTLDAESWRSVNDNVMGGVSDGRMLADDSGMRFSGRLSLENNGGFSSVRRLVTEALQGVDGIRLRIKGDGRTYQLRLRQDRNFDGVAWRMEFPTSGGWQTVEVSLAEFEPVFRGRRVRGAGELQPERIRQMGFMIADKNAGEFNLRIAGIEWTGSAPDAPAQTDA